MAVGQPKGEPGMRAVLCIAPGRLALVERPLPEIAPGMVAVDIKAIGVCGTDFHIFEGTHPFLEYPRVIGHEFSGVVAAGGPDSAFAAGMPVVDQSLSLLRGLRCLPQGQAQLLRPAQGPRGSCRRGHVRADRRACRQPLSGRRAQPPRCGDGRVPGDRRPCGLALGSRGRRAGARRRCRPDRRRRRVLRPPGRRRSDA